MLLIFDNEIFFSLNHIRINFVSRCYINREKFIGIAAANPEIRVSSADPCLLLAFTAVDAIGSQKEWVFLVRYVYLLLIISLQSSRYFPLNFHSSISHTRETDGLGIQDISFNALQRKCANLSLGQPLSVRVYSPGVEDAIVAMKISIDLLKKVSGGPALSLDSTEMETEFKKIYENQVFVVGQLFALDFKGQKFDVLVESFEYPMVEGMRAVTKSRGIVVPTVNIEFVKRRDSSTPILFTSGKAGSSTNSSLFKQEFNFEQVGIGGLGSEFQTIFRRAFASRIFPGLIKEIGMNHVRGMLLYGPPGCGKTLIARQIGKILNAREPKIVNGPEVLDKYVGGSEEKIRALFEDAEKEQKEMGDASMLHVIIFDEMDAIMKSRGSTRDSTGVADSIVNQLLSKIDGVDSLNNILIIGMTNRKDMIDEAVLRPGRLELHVEIGLPNEEGRLQIINIHTAQMRKNHRISEEAVVKLPQLAEVTKNYTGIIIILKLNFYYMRATNHFISFMCSFLGAEIEGMVRNAASFAFARAINLQDLKNAKSDNIRVEWEDFTQSVAEFVPAFGNKDQLELKTLYRNGIISYGESFEFLQNSLLKLVNQSRISTRTPLLSVLLEGPTATGKTALAAKICQESDFPLIRILSPDSMIGFSEGQKCATIQKAFTDAYKSSLSIIFIDDVERLIEYTPLGPRFLNMVLQTLIIYLKKTPPNPDRRLLVIGTTAIAGMLEDLQLTQSFNVQLNVSQLQEPSEFAAVLREKSNISATEIDNIASAIVRPIGIKKLLMVLEMVVSSGDELNVENFMACLNTIGY